MNRKNKLATLGLSALVGLGGSMTNGCNRECKIRIHYNEEEKRITAIVEDYDGIKESRMFDSNGNELFHKLPSVKDMWYTTLEIPGEIRDCEIYKLEVLDQKNNLSENYYIRTGKKFYSVNLAE